MPRQCTKPPRTAAGLREEQRRGRLVHLIDAEAATDAFRRLATALEHGRFQSAGAARSRLESLGFTLTWFPGRRTS